MSPSEEASDKARSRVPRGLSRGFTRDRASLVIYLMAGYPDRERSLAALHAVADAGADVVELGVPYSDPLADGPVIQRASQQALAAEGGFGLAEAIDLAASFTCSDRPEARHVPPVALMTYLNPILRMGFGRVARAASDAGVAGFIVPDMPPDSPFASRWLAESEPLGIDTVFLVAPTSTDDRLDQVGKTSSGFVYCVSTTGITGERAQLPAELSGLVARVKAHTALPVAVGFGVSTPAHAAAVAGVADGVIVGSAVVKRQHDLADLRTFVRSLAEAAHSGR